MDQTNNEINLNLTAAIKDAATMILTSSIAEYINKNEKEYIQKLIQKNDLTIINVTFLKVLDDGKNLKAEIKFYLEHFVDTIVEREDGSVWDVRILKTVFTPYLSRELDPKQAKEILQFLEKVNVLALEIDTKLSQTFEVCVKEKP